MQIDLLVSLGIFQPPAKEKKTCVVTERCTLYLRERYDCLCLHLRSQLESSLFHFYIDIFHTQFSVKAFVLFKSLVRNITGQAAQRVN